MRACAPSALRLIHLLEVSILLIGELEQVAEVLHAVVGFLLGTSNHSHKRALVASVDNGWTLILMRKQLLIWNHLLASLVSVTAPEHELAEEVPRHSVHAVKLTLVPAEWASVRVLLKPVSFAVAAQWLFANNAFYRVLKDIVADPTDKFGQKRLDVRFVKNAVFFKAVL